MCLQFVSALRVLISNHHQDAHHVLLGRLMSFKDLGVNPALTKVLHAGGIEKPFPIQKATLPDAIAGKDILGRGQTGSGKLLLLVWH